MFKTVSKKFKNYRTLQLIAEVGEYTFLITKPGNSEKKNAEILEKLQDIAELEYGDTVFAFSTKIHCGPGHDWRKDSGAKVMVLIPAQYYDEEKRLEGKSGTWENLLSWIPDHTLKVKKARP